MGDSHFLIRGGGRGKRRRNFHTVALFVSDCTKKLCGSLKIRMKTCEWSEKFVQLSCPSL